MVMAAGKLARAGIMREIEVEVGQQYAGLWHSNPGSYQVVSGAVGERLFST